MRCFRRGSRFVLDIEPYRQTIDRNARAKILHLAEGLERASKAKGRRSGILGQTGLAILRCLLLRFLRAGAALDPSYRDIQRATGFSRATIAKGLAALEAVGILKRARRIGRAWIERISPLTGELERFLGTVQLPSLLTVRLPAARFIPLPTRVHRAAGKTNTGASREEIASSEASTPLDIGSWKPLPRPSASPDWRSSARILLSRTRAA